MNERHPLEYHPIEQEPIKTVENQAVFGPLHDMTMDERNKARNLQETREALKLEINKEPIGSLVDHAPTVLPDIPKIDPSPIGVIKEKAVKKEQARIKESSPKSYTEMLVVVNDLQLLRSVDGEAIGAFMKWLKVNGKKVTHFVANGDILDFEAQSGFPAAEDPEQSKNAIAYDEIEAGGWFFRTVAELTPNAKERVVVFGNHENRYFNKLKDAALDGELPWLKTPEEMFRFRELGWTTIPYGVNQKYEWHDRIFWHGARAGAKSDIAKLELQDTGLMSVSTAHVNRNMYHEERRANGELVSGLTHGGFSKDSLGFMKKANTGWSQGFGIYYYDKKVGEQPYSVIMKHGNPRFIDPTGEIYDGTGFNLRQEIGLDPKPKRR